MLNLDIDGNGVADQLTDGSLVIRYLSGFRGDALIMDGIGENATRTTATEIETYLAAAESTVLDIDGNGVANALTDGILINRYLSGLRGDDLINGTIGDNATRTTAPEIEAFIAGLLPN